MKIGDLVTYAAERTGPCSRELGTVLRGRQNANAWPTGTQYFVIWHTVDNKGWWNADLLKVASTNENR